MSDHITTLTTDLLVYELKGITEWQSLGLYLGLGMAEIKEIEQDHPDTPRRRMEMLEKWMRKEGNPSWEMVVEALEKMSEQRLANQLRVKYCTQQHQDEKPLTSKSEEQADSQVTEMEKVLKVDRKDAVAQEIESLEENYLILVTSTEFAVEDTNPPPKKIKRFSQFYMKAEVDNVDELFDQMKPFYFLDYRILEKIIKFFLEQDQSVASQLDEYIRQLNEFKSSTTVQQFMESIEAAQRPLTTADSSTKTTVIIQLVGGWLQKTIMDLDKLLKVLFQDKTSVLSHLRISPGSVIITYLTPLSEVDGLIMIVLDQVPFMLQVGVHALVIGDTVVTSTQSDTLDFSFESSIIKAVIEDKIDILSFLLNINTSPDAAIDNGQTGLLFGSYYGKSKAVSLLLKANANPNLQTNNGLTPLFMASLEGHTDIVSLLLKANPNPNLHRDDGVTPLAMASNNGHADIVSLLLKANANPNLYDNNGVTPLLAVSQNGRADIASLLLKANANPNFHRDSGPTPLLLAASHKGHADIVSLLIKANANPNLSTDDGLTPLMVACFCTHPEAVQLLLAAEANPNLLFYNGLSALMFACYVGCFESVELLLMYGADPNLRTLKGVTALGLAATRGHEDIVDLIHAVELSKSFTSPVLTASEIAANVDNETLKILNRAMEKMLVDKVETFISIQSQKHKKILPLKDETCAEIL